MALDGGGCSVSSCLQQRGFACHSGSGGKCHHSARVHFWGIHRGGSYRRKAARAIDTRNHTEELLGYEVEGKFDPAYGNEAIAPSCFWHPKQDMAAMQILIFRHPREIWVWRHGSGLRPIHEKEVIKLLNSARGDIIPGAGINMDVVRWKGETLEFKVEYTSQVDGSFIDHTGLLQWDSATDQLRVLGDRVDGTRKIE